MKAAWDWHLPTDTKGDQEAIVEFAADLGFDTLVVQKATEEMVRRGEALRAHRSGRGPLRRAGVF
jgi:hypothetical protein